MAQQLSSSQQARQQARQLPSPQQARQLPYAPHGHASYALPAWLAQASHGHASYALPTWLAEVSWHASHALEAQQLSSAQQAWQLTDASYALVSSSYALAPQLARQLSYAPHGYAPYALATQLAQLSYAPDALATQLARQLSHASLWHASHALATQLARQIFRHVDAERQQPPFFPSPRNASLPIPSVVPPRNASLQPVRHASPVVWWAPTEHVLPLLARLQAPF
jgi:hypothetical protein